MGESTKYFLLENMIMIEPERAFVKELFNKDCINFYILNINDILVG